MTAQPLRIGDAERETAATALGEHYATGRLSKEEYDERAARVWAARFQSDLEPLFTDLPNPWRPTPAPVRPRPAMPMRRPVPPFAPLAPILVVGLVAMAILTGMPWLLFGLFWLCAFAAGGRRQTHRLGR